jgi:hypothetical protein
MTEEFTSSSELDEGMQRAMDEWISSLATHYELLRELIDTLSASGVPATATACRAVRSANFSPGVSIAIAWVKSGLVRVDLTEGQV